METTTDFVTRALAKEERRAELIANTVRLVVLTALAFVAVVNFRSLTLEANILNASALLIGYIFGFVVYHRTRRPGHHPAMKYITSCLDVFLVFLLLFSYTQIEIPAVAVKNYVFLVVFPLIAMTAFRYDRTLTYTAGGLAVSLYLIILGYLSFSNAITLSHGGYEQELFSAEVTYIGQATKILILIGFILLMASLAQYSRSLLVKLVQEESSLRVQQEQTNWELKTASQVQARLLPQTFPTIKGLELFAIVQQGKYVGGDYCDFMKRNDGSILMVTADVSGKGIPAALIMAEIRASTHSLAAIDIDLTELIGHLNTLVHSSTSSKDFVTCFVATIDVQRQIVRYVNAGHPPPFVCSRLQIRALAERTIPLGILATLPTFHVAQERFASGDILISYTDGLTEQRNIHDEEFGEERLKTYTQAHIDLPAEPFALALLKHLGEFGVGRERHDDVGLAVARMV